MIFPGVFFRNANHEAKPPGLDVPPENPQEHSRKAAKDEATLHATSFLQEAEVAHTQARNSPTVKRPKDLNKFLSQNLSIMFRPVQNLARMPQEEV